MHFPQTPLMTEADVMQFPSMHYLRAFADVSGENQGNN